MMMIQCEGAFVIQNRAAKIARAKIRVSQVVKQICVPLACANERLVTGDRFFEMTLRVFLVRFCELSVRLGKADQWVKSTEESDCDSAPKPGVSCCIGERE